MNIGHVKACHDPRNALCPHNAGIQFNCDCHTPVEQRKERKTFKVVRVVDPTVENHKLSNRLVLEIHPNGLLRIREQGKRTVYETTVGRVFEGIVWRVAMAEARAKKAARRGGRKGGRK